MLPTKSRWRYLRNYAAPKSPLAIPQICWSLNKMEKKKLMSKIVLQIPW